MLKKIIALLLCVLMLIPALSACSKRDENDQGPMITMYLSGEIYNFDPAYAYYNSVTRNIVSLLFETLFTLDDDGKIQKSLVNDYEYIETPEKDEYKLVISLKDTAWSNGLPVTSDDVVYSWKRLLNTNNSFEAASLLFDIKNARAVKEGDESIDNLGVEATSQKIVTVFFEGPVDLDSFFLNLTSVATAPLPESHIEKDADWAKKGSTMICSGPFKLGKVKYEDIMNDNGTPDDPEDDYPIQVRDDYVFNEWGELSSPHYSARKKISYFVLERNSYYYRDAEEDPIYKSVTPHRLLVNCGLTAEELEAEYANNHIFYIGDIPCSLRQNADSAIMQNAKVTDTMSTFSLFFNQNAEINGTALFAKKEVRQALSMAINRTAIAEAIVFAEVATGIVPNGVFEAGAATKKNSVNTFRDNANNSLISASDNITGAQALLTSAGVNPADYSFTIKVATYDAVNVMATNMIAEAWRQLGFDVKVEEVVTIVNNDVLKAIADDNEESINFEKEVMSDICDDLFVESITRATYEVIAFDYTAFSADAYSVLANFAKSFAGMAVDMTSDNYDLLPNRTGYDSEAYNNLMEAIYYIPYFASLNRDTDYDFLGIYDTAEEFQATYDAVKAVYEAYGITPTTDKNSWKSQKAALLHKAEEMLLDDMPIVPVVFNKSADSFNTEVILDTTSNYYVPTLFTEATLKNYLNYTYYNQQGKLTSIFASFPVIEWEMIGMN